MRTVSSKSAWRTWRLATTSNSSGCRGRPYTWKTRSATGGRTSGVPMPHAAGPAGLAASRRGKALPGGGRAPAVLPTPSLVHPWNADVTGACPLDRAASLPGPAARPDTRIIGGPGPLHNAFSAPPARAGRPAPAAPATTGRLPGRGRAFGDFTGVLPLLRKAGGRREPPPGPARPSPIPRAGQIGRAHV